MNFTNLSNVQMFLNKSSLSTTETATLTLLIGMVDGIVKNYCGWEILAKTYTKLYNGDGTDTLDVKYAPVNSVDSLTIAGEDYLASVSINSEDGNLYFASDTGLTFTSGTRNVEVVFNAGYSTPPEDLAYAASWLVAINFNRIAGENIGVVNEEFQGIKAEYDKVDIPVMVKQVLDRYRYISIY